MKSRIAFLDYTLDDLSMDETVNIIDNAIKNNKQIVREDLNAAKIIWMQQDPDYTTMIQNANIINADGMSIVKAVKFLSGKTIDRITGIDLMEEIITLADRNHYKIFFLGAEKKIVEQTVLHYSNIFSKEIIAGYHDGYFTDEEQIIDLINQSNANILFIGMSSPKKEKFIHTYKDQLNSDFIMGVGGSFDVIAGKVKRAPIWMQNAGLEWFYRLSQEPGRMWKRYLYSNSIFLWLIFKEKIFNKKENL